MCSIAAVVRKDAALAHPPGDDLGRRIGAEPLELVESTSKCVIVVGVGEREGRFIGAADLRPELRCAGPVAGDLHRVGLDGLARSLGLEPGAPTPQGKLPDRPRDSLP